jgi:hypothetical protein
MSQELLKQRIVELSEASAWQRARDEWRLQEIWFSEEPMTCQCGHNPIREICVIRNRLNGNTAEVGNHCVNSFLGINSEKIFSSVRKVVKDVSASLNSESIKLAHERGYINDWEHDFYLDTWRKRNLSFNQAFKKRQINEKLLDAVTKRDLLAEQC